MLKKLFISSSMATILLTGGIGEVFAETSIYNEPMTYTPKQSLYDFGATTNLSGYNDNLKLANKLPTSTLSTRELTSKPNIAVVGNMKDDSNIFTYGTGTAIGKHTLITNAHVVQKHTILKPYDTQNLKQLFVQPQRIKNSIPYTYKVDRVDMIKGTDVALVHTKEDLSKVMRIYRLENESVIKNIKDASMQVRMTSYSYHPIGFETAEVMTPLQSHGYYLNNGRSIHPVNYLKINGSTGGSGAALINSNNRIVGVYAASYGTPYYKAGYSLTGDSRKQIEQKIY